MSNTVILESAEFITETDKAVLVEFDDGSSEPELGVNRFWIPKSVIESADDFSEEGDIADLEVQAWFVRDNDELEAFATE